MLVGTGAAALNQHWVARGHAGATTVNWLLQAALLGAEGQGGLEAVSAEEKARRSADKAMEAWLVGGSSSSSIAQQHQQQQQ